MKKFLFVIIAVLTLFMFNMYSCKHVHTYSSEWSYNEDYHYRKANCKHKDLITAKSPHEYLDENDFTCNICGKVRVLHDTVASVYNGEVCVAQYNNFSDAISNFDSGNKIVIEKNTTIDSFTVLENTEMTIDLNGFTVKVNPNSSGKGVIVNGKLSVLGDGFFGDKTHENVGYLFFVDGTLNISGDAVYECGLECVQLNKENSKAYIHGGYFVGDKYRDEWWTINKLDSVKDTALCEIDGGSFVGFNPEIAKTENPPQNWVKEGYKVIEQGRDEYVDAVIYKVVKE